MRGLGLQGKVARPKPLAMSNRKSVYVQPTVNRFTSKAVYGSMHEETSSGASLMTLRQRAGLTQKAVADALEVTDHTVRNWEKGRTVPEWTPAQTLLVCQMLKCSLEELASAFGSNRTENA